MELKKHFSPHTTATKEEGKKEMSHYRYTIDELKEIKKTMTVDEDFEKKVDLFLF